MQSDWRDETPGKDSLMIQNRCSFERAARNLAARYARRFPDGRSWDATSIKDRWYRRQTCQYVRVRLSAAGR
jgi:hypothetical protein